MRKQAEPNVTPARFIGSACPKCGFHVRYLKTRSCVWCHKGLINKSKLKKARIIGHPYRERILKLNQSRMARLRTDPKHRAREQANYRKYYLLNYQTRLRDSKITSAREREVLESSRVPAWANRRKIAAIYARARRLGKVVDHVVPLKSPIVCGLHVETNLRVVARSTNAQKGNKLIEALL